MRVDFVKAAAPLLEADPQSLFITGDLGYNALEGLAKALGKRFLNAGVAEQNMVGVAAGLAMAGYRPWLYSIAPFATYRCLEQIRNDVCLHRLPVRIVGNGGGYTYGIMGSTHHALEDLAVLKALPNMQLFFPCANDHVAAAVTKMSALPHPAYLRLSISGFSSQELPLAENPETLTRVYQRAKAPRATLIAVGHAAQIALTARKHGLGDLPVDFFGVARFPLLHDSELAASLAQTGRGLVIEEHYRPGGIGESLCAAYPEAKLDLMSASYSPEQKYGSANFHLRQCGLTPECLISNLRELLP